MSKQALRSVGKVIRNIFISMGVLLVLFVGGGVAYTWYVGQDETENTAAIAKPVEATISAPQRAHIKPAANAPVSASVQMITSPVMPGENASLTVKSTPEAKCTILVEYDDVKSTDSGLIPKVTDEFGVQSWTWTVEESAPLGTWPVVVECLYNKKTAVVAADLVVSRDK